jgi:hypothetical protein
VKSIGRKLTYANVMSSLAVFLVLGGATAFAATHLDRNSVGTAQLKPGAVTGAKLRQHAVTGEKIADGTITSKDIAPKSISGTDIAPGSIPPDALQKPSQTSVGSASETADGLFVSGHAFEFLFTLHAGEHRAFNPPEWGPFSLTAGCEQQGASLLVTTTGTDSQVMIVVDGSSRPETFTNPIALADVHSAPPQEGVSPPLEQSMPFAHRFFAPGQPGRLVQFSVAHSGVNLGPKHDECRFSGGGVFEP